MPTPVQLDFSKSQPIAPTAASGGSAGVQLDFSKAQPVDGVTPASSATSTQSPGMLDPGTESGIGSRIVEGLKGAANSLVSPFMHPLDTLASMGQAAMTGSTPYGTPYIAPTGNQSRDAANQKMIDTNQSNVVSNAADMVKNHPAYLAGSVLGPAALGAGIESIPKVARGGMDIIAKTGPKVAANLVDATAEGNAAASDAANEANAKTAAKRTQQLQQNFQATQTAQQANDAASGALTRKAALQRGVETLDPQIQSELSATEARTRTEANRRYNELNSTLNDEQAPPALLGDILTTASEAMKGSNTETPIMRDMEKRMNASSIGGDEIPALSYRDLQGYRSEIGRELQRGNLPGDVYQAYKGMQGKITDAMENIAKANGMGDQFTGARSYYKQFMDTFHEPQSPINKALNSTERGGTVKAFQGKDQSGIEALAKYNPELAQRVNTVRGYQTEAKGIPAKGPTPKVAPTLAPKPTPVTPELTQIGPDDIQAAKAEQLVGRADKIRNTGHGMATTFAVLDGLRNAFHGNFTGTAIDAAARMGFSAAQHAVAAALENPNVVQWLTKPTAADLAELQRLPPEQRTAQAQNIQQLVSAASAKGIPVSPSIRALGMASGATGATQSSHPLATMPQ